MKEKKDDVNVEEENSRSIHTYIQIKMKKKSPYLNLYIKKFLFSSKYSYSSLIVMYVRKQDCVFESRL